MGLPEDKIALMAFDCVRGQGHEYFLFMPIHWKSALELDSGLQTTAT